MLTKNKQILSLIKTAVAEDAPRGDITSEKLVPKNMTVKGCVISKGDYVVSGLEVAKRIYVFVDKKISFKTKYSDGDFIKNGETLFEVKGNARSLLLAERITLNMVSHMMGIATKTKTFVDLIKGTNVIILDTRKTLPGMRLLQRMAVKDGGGANHRFSLSDALLAKENHISASGGITTVLEKLSKLKNIKIEMEVRNLNELREALKSKFKPHVIMLDNMTIDQVKEAVKMNNGTVKLEVSGGVNEQTVLAYAQTGVDFISLGMLTHDVKSADLSFLLI